MVKPHISISEDLKSRLDIYCKENNFQCFSHGVIDLLEKALSQSKLDKVLDHILNSVDRLNSKSSYTRDLLEQLYSNLEIETETNPKSNKSLQKFKNKYIKDKFND